MKNFLQIPDGALQKFKNNLWDNIWFMLGMIILPVAAYCVVYPELINVWAISAMIVYFGLFSFWLTLIIE
jgi:hypothetical protein